MSRTDDPKSGADESFTIRTLTIQFLGGRTIVPCAAPSKCGPLSMVAVVFDQGDPAYDLETFSRALREATKGDE